MCPEHPASRILHRDHIRSPILKIGDAVGNHRIGNVCTIRTAALQWNRPGHPQLRHVRRSNGRVRDPRVVQVLIRGGPLRCGGGILHGGTGQYRRSTGCSRRVAWQRRRRALH
ncbi:MAG: hypothetical protein ABI465_19325 [Ktedonobacteraceae bacterium]